MQRALALLRAGVPAADSAARSSYADQPHLCRDVKDLTGVPVARLMA